MKKIIALALAVVTLLCCLVGCDTAKIEVGVENGTAYFHYAQITPDIILTGESETEIEGTSFFGKLRTAIDGKPAVDDVCNCEAIYNVRIDKYTFGLHTHGIMVSSPMGNNIKGVNVFTVECSEEEMNELFGIIESVLKKGNSVRDENSENTSLLNNTVILKDGFTFKGSWIDSNNELDESKTLVIESQEALDEIFTEFKEIDFEKEMVIVYCYTTIYVREQKLEKVSFDNNVLSIEFDVVDGKPGTGDATAPQTRTCVICLDKVAATEVKITYNGQ